MDQVCNIKVKRHVTRGQFNANRTFIVESPEEERQPGTKLRVYSLVFVKIYLYFSLLFVKYSFSSLIGFQDNLTTPSRFVFILIIERSNYRTCKSNRWIWEMRKYLWNDDCFLLPLCAYSLTDTRWHNWFRGTIIDCLGRYLWLYGVHLDIKTKTILSVKKSKTQQKVSYNNDPQAGEI